MIWIPEGFTQDFFPMKENTRSSYLTTEECYSEHEREVIWNDTGNDTDIDGEWPERDVIILEKDSWFPRLADAHINFIYRGK